MDGCICHVLCSFFLHDFFVVILRLFKVLEAPLYGTLSKMSKHRSLFSISVPATAPTPATPTATASAPAPALPPAASNGARPILVCHELVHFGEQISNAFSVGNVLDGAIVAQQVEAAGGDPRGEDVANLDGQDPASQLAIGLWVTALDEFQDVVELILQNVGESARYSEEVYHSTAGSGTVHHAGEDLLRFRNTENSFQCNLSTSASSII